VSESVAVPDAPAPAPPIGAALRPRFDFRPSAPDVSTFPRTAWARAVRDALAAMSDADLDYGDPRGADVLRVALASYLGRVRGVVADPARVLVTCGYSQGLGLVCRALAERGATRVALEDPSNPEQAQIARRAGLEPVAVAVDEEGLRVDALAATGADAVVLTPAHQDPTGVVLSGARRTAIVAWRREHAAVAIEDDYDAEYRYDRAAVGALQGLDADRVVYLGSASKTLAPALRLGWMVLPAALVEPVSAEKVLADRGTNRIDQHAFAGFLERGELDRHLRRMRIQYRALGEALPEGTVQGVAAGLHVTVRLPDGVDEAAVRAEAQRRGIALSTLGANRIGTGPLAPTLLLGYARLPEATIAPGVRELAAAVRRVAETP
jgi:GntR family transcriptional regulator/MocR family aminotransferase